MLRRREPASCSGKVRLASRTWPLGRQDDYRDWKADSPTMAPRAT